MALVDSTLIGLLTHDAVTVRSAALELLSSSFSNDQRWLPQVLAAWDLYGPSEAFPEFPLLTHFAIPPDLVGECIERASEMATGRGLTDRVCRCAGKLVEAISVSAPVTFQQHVPAIRKLKQISKIFFRISDQKMQARCEWIDREFADLAETLAENPSSIVNLYDVLESQFLQGRIDDILKANFAGLLSGDQDRTTQHVALTCLELATRYRMIGYEAYFVELIDHQDPTIADAASIGLARCRTDTTLPLIADRFADYSKSGQLRSIDVLRRGRIPKTSELLRFLRAYAHGSQVQNALRASEILQFDFTSLEDWLEALLVVDDSLFAQLKSQLAVINPLSDSLSNSDKARTLHLLKTRFKE
jgi:hypothetical protein